MNLKKTINYIYDNYRSKIIWTLLALHAIVVSIYSYNN
jgi:hypothetical protein